MHSVYVPWTYKLKISISQKFMVPKIFWGEDTTLKISSYIFTFTWKTIIHDRSKCIMANITKSWSCMVRDIPTMISLYIHMKIPPWVRFVIFFTAHFFYRCNPFVHIFATRSTQLINLLLIMNLKMGKRPDKNCTVKWAYLKTTWFILISWFCNDDVTEINFIEEIGLWIVCIK